MDENEQGLIRLARQGNNAAWAEIVRRHQEAVFRLAYLITRDSTEAEDVTQETLLRVMRHLERFDDRQPIRPWILQITRNLARNRSRAILSYGRMLLRFRNNDSSQRTSSVEHGYEQRTVNQSLHKALERLEYAEREVIYLRYFLNLSISDTSRVLDVAEGTVKSRLHRALKRLESFINKDFPEIREGIFSD